MNLGQFLAQKMFDADKQAASGNAEQAYPLYIIAQKFALEMGQEKTLDYIDNKLKESHYDPQKYNNAMFKGLALLEQSNPDLTEAANAFVEALTNKPHDKAALTYTSYINDLKFCNKAGQALYSAMRPSQANINQFTWTADDRTTAFCIDRYEHPNVAGSLPTVDVPFIVAQQECKKNGKDLCTPLRWTDACKGTNITNQFPYGNGKDADPSACNLDSDGLVPSGSKPACKNSIGVFDMSGNAAEWTAESGNDGAVPVIKGGSFRDKATVQDSGCAAEFTHSSDFKAPFVGFRCCRDLETKK
jgi:formylglycine-generating enzyme required for sulfatase activity